MNRPDPFVRLCWALFAVTGISALLTFGVQKSGAVELPAPAPRVTKDYPVGKDVVYQVTTAATLATTRQFLMVGEHGIGILALNGVPITEPTPPPDLPAGSLTFRNNGPILHRPDKPEQIKITVYTTDGKKWRAVWEPEK